ncbi:unnamed protein product, partial [Linum tenue]
ASSHPPTFSSETFPPLCSSLSPSPSLFLSAQSLSFSLPKQRLTTTIYPNAATTASEAQASKKSTTQRLTTVGSKAMHDSGGNGDARRWRQRRCTTLAATAMHDAEGNGGGCRRW